jgi:hypothetical protein
VVVSATVFAVVPSSVMLTAANAAVPAKVAAAAPTKIRVRSLRMVCLPLDPCLGARVYVPTAIDPQDLLPMQVTGLQAAKPPWSGTLEEAVCARSRAV